MYDFDANTTTICNIDFYSKSPFKNEMGRMRGSSRFLLHPKRLNSKFKNLAYINECKSIFIPKITLKPT